MHFDCYNKQKIEPISFIKLQKMQQLQMLFMSVTEVLLNTRLRKITQFKTKGFQIFSDPYPNYHELLQKNWRQDNNEMILQFFLEQEGQSYLVEEWSLLVSNQQPIKQKQMTIFLRSVLCMITITNWVYLQGYQVSHSFHFYNKHSKKRGDWANDSQVIYKTIKQDLKHMKLQLTVAYQGDVINSLQQKQEIFIPRQRFLSVQESARIKTTRKNTLDTSYSSNLNKSFVSVFSKKEDVEILSTPEEAERMLQDGFDQNDYEIQMITENNEEGELLKHTFLSGLGMSVHQKIQIKSNIESLNQILIDVQYKRNRDSIQIPKLLNQF
ncbi:hypothetical protein pb186bvf_011855 [Paramecium bursaria]